MPGIMMPEVMLQVLRSGGSLVLSQPVMPDTMRACAEAAKAGGGQVTFRVNAIMPNVAVEVAAAGPGHVTFDLT